MQQSTLAMFLKALQNFSKDFSSCIYDWKDEEDFVNVWQEMLDKCNTLTISIKI